MKHNQKTFHLSCTAILLFICGIVSGAGQKRFSISDTAPTQLLSSSPVAISTAAAIPPENIRYDRQRWNDMRKALEQQGLEPGEKAHPKTRQAITISTGTAKPTAEPEKKLAVELPYESELSIAGRKTIELKLKSTQYKKSKAQELKIPQSQQTFDMKQQLQARIQGKVGRKVTVNVDVDDTKENKQDIAVAYRGDPEEIVQSADFGDIALSLPATEFVSYSKQVFGIKSDLKYKDLRTTIIGTRTKGTTETKRFFGNVTMERKDIPDTGYIRRRYYDLTFQDTSPGRLPIAGGSEEIWLDDRNPTNNTPNTKHMVVESTGSVTSFTGDFDQLVRGRDYTVDYLKGIIQFRITFRNDAVIAVDYTRTDGVKLSNSSGTPGQLKIIKDETEGALTQELKTFYSTGRTKIIRDNGKGNFIFKVLDLNRNEITPAGLTNPVYPNDIEFDFESGIFNFARGKRFPENDVYAPSPTHHSIFFLEYRYRQKLYSLRPNIVLQSERVTMDGRMLARDIDYFIDYDSGIITFYNEDKITDETSIEVTYEFAPFGGQLGETLAGNRTTYSITPKPLGGLSIGAISFGSSALLSFAPKPTTVPDIRSTPSSILVFEGDSRISDIKLPLLPLKISSLSTEIVRSNQDPNTTNKAIVESMESVRQEDALAMIAKSWMPAGNPDGSVMRLNKLTLGDELIKTSDINPNVTDKNATQAALNLSWSDLTTKPGSAGNDEQLSLIYVLSTTGRDFSKKNTFEIWVNGAGASGSGIELAVDLGSFREDADGDGTLDTEDTIIHDGTLNFGEDVGWLFNLPENNGIVRVGAGNGILDSEDLDKDGILDPDSPPLRPEPIFRLKGATGFDPSTQTSQTYNDLNFTGWRLFTIPLNITPAEETAWQSIKQARLTLSGKNAGSGSIKIGAIAVVGNTWEHASLSVAGSTMNVSAVNNVDTADYESLLGNPDFNSLYGTTSENRREQALSLSYDLAPGATATTRTVYAQPHDFSRHNSFRFFVNGKKAQRTGDEFFFMQIGSDSDYFECRLPITSSGWQKINLNLIDRNNDGMPDTWVATDPQATTAVKGNPAFSKISQIKLGINNASQSSTRKGEIWVNEIHLAGSRKKIGQAGRFSGEFEVPGWMNFGGSYRDTNRNFQTLTTVVTNQDKKESSAHLSLTRIRLLPLNFNGSHSLTVTPSAIQTGDSQLVSTLEEGKVTSMNGSGNGELALANVFPRISSWLPKITFGYDKSISDSNLLMRTDDRDTYRGSLDYSLPIWQKLDILPTRYATFRPFPSAISASYSRTNYFLKFTTNPYTSGFIKSSTVAFNNAAVLEMQDNVSGRLSFAPWEGFLFSPNLSLKTVREERRFKNKDNVLLSFPGFAPLTAGYPKSLNETAGLSGSLKLYFRWLEPRFNYSFNGSETNALPTASSPTAFGLKTFDRTSSGDVSWNASLSSIVPWARPVKSLNIDSTYRLENGDSYENVDKDFKWLSRVWVTKNQLKLTNVEARRKSLTSRNTMRFHNSYNPFEFIPFGDRFSPVKNISTIGTYTGSREETETTGTKNTVLSKTWPDLVISVKEIEKLMFLERWVGNSQLNFRTNQKITETIASSMDKNQGYGGDWRFTIKNRYDLFFNIDRTLSDSLNLKTGNINNKSGNLKWSTQLGFPFGSWRYTPRYDVNRNIAKDGSGKSTADIITRSTSLQIYGDHTLKSGLRIPFTGKGVGAGHRLIINSNLKWDRNKSSLNVERDNTDNYSFNLNGDYSISNNFRLTLGGSTSYISNRVKSNENVVNIEFSSTLTIQF